MTEKELRCIVRAWKKRVGLADWDIKLRFDCKAPNEETQAEVATADDSREAIMYFYDWSKWNSLRANRIVVHELLHILNRDVENIFGSIDGQLPRNVESVAEHGFRHAVEVFIDHQARLLVALGGVV